MRSPCRRVLLPLIALVAVAALPASAHALPGFVSVAPVVALEGERIRDNDFGARFTDACGVDYTITVSWGDGTTSAGEIDRIEPVAGTCNYHVVGEHQYRNAGTYAIGTQVCDATGCRTGTGTATIAASAIRGEAFPISAVAERPFTGEVAEFNDDNRLSQPADFTAVIDWGDGTTSPGIVHGQDGRLDVSGQHVYARGGSYIVRVTLLRGGVARATSDPRTATVADAGSATTIQGVTTPSRNVVGTERLGPSLRLRTTSIRRRSLARGLPIRLVAPVARSFRVAVVRLGGDRQTLGRVTLRVRSGLRADGLRISNSRVRLSASLRRRMRAGRYELQIRLADNRLLRARFTVR
jgi:hypothetical protein